MGSSRRAAVIAGFFAACLLAAGAARACQIPVFRYALERWSPDKYTVVVFHHGTLSASDEKLVEQIEQAARDVENPANVQVRKVDAGGEMSPHARLLLARHAVPEQPTWVVLLYPQGVRNYPEGRTFGSAAWKGPFNKAFVDGLIDSPARRAVARQIVEGESAVWVFIASGDRAKDKRAFATLTVELDRMQKLLRLPSADDLSADALFKADTQVKLRLGFKIVSLQRTDTAERVFVSMLLHSEHDLAGFQEPIAIPIFGRGRSYYALVGRGINAETIEENCRFLIGGCSCQIKNDNPGADLLFAVGWDRLVTGSAMPDKPLPELTGLGSFGPGSGREGRTDVTLGPATVAAVAAAGDAPSETLVSGVLPAAPPGGAADRPPAATGASSLGYLLSGLLLFGIVVLLVGSVFVRSSR